MGYTEIPGLRKSEESFGTTNKEDNVLMRFKCHICLHAHYKSTAGWHRDRVFESVLYVVVVGDGEGIGGPASPLDHILLLSSSYHVVFASLLSPHSLKTTYGCTLITI